MNHVVYHTPSGDSSWRVPYAPKPWLFWVRIAQIICVLVTLVCTSYSAAKFYGGVPMSFFTIAWTIIYLPLVIWLVPRIQARYTPNVIVLVFESLCWMWWLSTFAMLAAWVSGSIITTGAVTGFYRRSSSSYDDVVDNATDAYNDAVDQYNDLVGAYGAWKAAAAFGAITWVLFCVSLIAVAIGFHKQRRVKQQQLRQTYERSAQNVPTHVQPMDSDKTYARATVNSV